MTARGEKNGKLKEGERENKEDLVKEEKPDEIRIPLTKFPLLRRQSSNRCDLCIWSKAVRENIRTTLIAYHIRAEEY